MDSVLCGSFLQRVCFIFFSFTRCAVENSSANVDSHVFSFHSVSFDATCSHRRCFTFTLFDVSLCVVIFIRFPLTLLPLNFLIRIAFVLYQLHFWSFVLFFSTWNFFLISGGGAKHSKRKFHHTTNDISNIHFNHHTHTHIRMRLNNQTRKINKRKDWFWINFLSDKEKNEEFFWLVNLESQIPVSRRVHDLNSLTYLIYIHTRST